MKKAICAIGILAMATAAVFAQGNTENGMTGTKEEKHETLQMYTALDTEEAKYYIDEFTKQTGIKVEFVRLSAGEVLARVEAEKTNPQASVWFGGSSTDHINAAAKGLLEPYKPNVDFTLADNLHASDNSWNGFYTGAIGFVSNTDFLKKNGLEAPTSWDDLLDPIYVGQIEMAYPYTSGTAYTTWATQIQRLGLDGALDWWAKFDKSIHQYTKSGTACIARAGLGECAVGLAFSHDILAKGVNMGYPLVMSFPKEGTGYEVGAVSLIKGGKQSKEAKLFIDWCFSVEAQNLFQKYCRLPVNPKATVGKGAIKLTDIKLINYDAVKMGLNKDTYVKAWRDRIGK
ncbi:MAG: ABC transporter substrate-binding protein [Spirochaetia bacterium]|jgi:iron(III) transport system substrate-binding protein|nr:ABC transporter substrate-binding protein [Spirochaetia bacterium]